MAVVVIEQDRHVETGQHPWAEFEYTVTGTGDEVVARQALVDGSPTTYDPWGSGLLWIPRNTLRIDAAGFELWKGRVYYGMVPQTTDKIFMFDTGGGVQHITQSLETRGFFARKGETAPDFRGAIGVTDDGVEGCDIVVPAFHFAETHYLAPALVTDAYQQTLRLMTGTVNRSPFRGYQSLLCRFDGAAGAKRGYGDWEITFRFASGVHVRNRQIGAIKGVEKKAHEYLWVRYEEEVDGEANYPVMRPRFAYAERVCDPSDFSQLLI